MIKIEGNMLIFSLVIMINLQNFKEMFIRQKEEMNLLLFGG